MLRSALASICGFIALAIYFWPLHSLPTGTIPSTFPDALEVIWTIWWQQHVIFDGWNSLYSTHSMFYPAGASLFLHPTVEGVTIPLVLLFKNLAPEQIYTLACFACLFFTFLAAKDLFFELCNSLFVGTALALFLTFHPYFTNRLNAGQLNFLCFFPVLICCKHFLRLVQHTALSKNSFFWFAISLGALPFFNLYYFYFCYLALGLTFVLLSLSRSDKVKLFIQRILPGMVLGIIPASWKLFSMAQLSATRSYTPNHDPLKHSGDLVSIIAPGPSQAIGSFFSTLHQDVIINTGESGIYFGVSILAFIILRWGKFTPPDKVMRNGLAALGIIFLCFTIGPVLQIAGQQAFPTFMYRAFETSLPLFPSVPARFGILYILSALMLIALSFKNNSFQQQRLLGLSILVLCVIEFFPIALNVGGIPVSSPALEMLKSRSDIHAVHDSSKVPQFSMMRQMVHHKALTRGFLARRPKSAERILRNNFFVRYLENGKESNQTQLKEGFLSLDVQALIIENTDRAQLSRVATLPWIKKFSEDNYVSVFGLAYY